MKRIGSPEISPEVSRAIEAGYIREFLFIEGSLCCEQTPAISYLIKDVVKIPIPDVQSRIVVYRIKAPDGIKGYAIADWEEDP